MILESLFGLAGFFQILAQAALFFFRPKKGEGICPRLSIVICGRNAELDWKQNLPSWLECKSSNLVEFILVDDGSSDASLSLLNGFAETDERIRVVRIVSKQSPGKRDALLLGLSHASHAQVFVTDADCKPDSPGFIQELMHILGHEPSLFVGNGVLKPGHCFASVLATADADRLARMNFSALPFLGFTTAVGRNMASRNWTVGPALFQKIWHGRWRRRSCLAFFIESLPKQTVCDWALHPFRCPKINAGLGPTKAKALHNGAPLSLANTAAFFFKMGLDCNQHHRVLCAALYNVFCCGGACFIGLVCAIGSGAQLGLSF